MIAFILHGNRNKSTITTRKLTEILNGKNLGYLGIQSLDPPTRVDLLASNSVMLAIFCLNPCLAPNSSRWSHGDLSVACQHYQPEPEVTLSESNRVRWASASPTTPHYSDRLDQLWLPDRFQRRSSSHSRTNIHIPSIWSRPGSESGQTGDHRTRDPLEPEH